MYKRGVTLVQACSRLGASVGRVIRAEKSSRQSRRARSVAIISTHAGNSGTDTTAVSWLSVPESSERLVPHIAAPQQQPVGIPIPQHGHPFGERPYGPLGRQPVVLIAARGGADVDDAGVGALPEGRPALRPDAAPNGHNRRRVGSDGGEAGDGEGEDESAGYRELVGHGGEDVRREEGGGLPGRRPGQTIAPCEDSIPRAAVE